MNRQARRKQGVKEKQKTYTMNEKQIEQLKLEASADAINKVLKMTIGVPLLVLHDKFGFGKKRLEVVIMYMMDKFDTFQKGYVTLDDYIQIIKDETGIDVNKVLEEGLKDDR